MSFVDDNRNATFAQADNAYVNVAVAERLKHAASQPGMAAKARSSNRQLSDVYIRINVTSVSLANVVGNFLYRFNFAARNGKRNIGKIVAPNALHYHIDNNAAFGDAVKNVERVVHPEDRERVILSLEKSALAAQVAGGHPFSLTYRLMIDGRSSPNAAWTARKASTANSRVIRAEILISLVAII